MMRHTTSYSPQDVIPNALSRTQRVATSYVLLTMAMIASCSSATSPQLSLGQELREKIVAEKRSRIPVADVANFEWSNVCLLTPYQDRLGEEHDMSKLANAELQRLGFISDEGTWVFIFEKNSQASIAFFNFKQSDQADFIGGSEARERVANGEISGIEPLVCARRDEAVLHRTVDGKRTYFIFGRDYK